MPLHCFWQLVDAARAEATSDRPFADVLADLLAARSRHEIVAYQRTFELRRAGAPQPLQSPALRDTGLEPHRVEVGRTAAARRDERHGRLPGRRGPARGRTLECGRGPAGLRRQFVVRQAGSRTQSAQRLGQYATARTSTTHTTAACDGVIPLVIAGRSPASRRRPRPCGGTNCCSMHISQVESAERPGSPGDGERAQHAPSHAGDFTPSDASPTAIAVAFPVAHMMSGLPLPI